MKKIFIGLLILALILAPTCFAGTLNVSGRAGVFNPPGGGSVSMMYGFGATYDITQTLLIRGAIETTSYTVNNQQTTYTPVTVDLIYRQNLGPFQPYVGAGLSYNSISAGGSSSTTSGAQAEAGIIFNFGGLSSGFEFRYLIPDLNNSANGYTSISSYMTGMFSQSFNL